jgi:L-ribulose-5-phosphate 4-epimerase
MLERNTVRLNKQIVDKGLVILTWGNGSIIDPEQKQIYIKPSGINVKQLTETDISVVDFDGHTIRGKKPSVDTQTHIELYKGFKGIGSVIHTHSLYCTIFAQLQEDIPCLGTTHADYFYGDIPVVDPLDDDQINNDYEKNTGISIVKYFTSNKIDPLHIPAALVPRHGVFVWGRNDLEAMENAIAAEHVAKMAYMQRQYDCIAEPIHQTLLDKHFLRKHGDTKYYGQ